MGKEKKEEKQIIASESSVIRITILISLLICTAALGGYLTGSSQIITKIVSNQETREKNSNSTRPEDKPEINNPTEITETTNKTIEIRSCIGTYSGQGAVTVDARTGEKTKGTITVDLKENGTYKLTKSGMDQYWTGHYTIIENALLLKEAPDTCGPGVDCSEKYFSFLNIADDCSKITGGYGSVFFDSDFKLMKNN